MMSRNHFLLIGLVFCIVMLGVFLAGCSSPAPLQETGAIHITSVPAGAEIYLDTEYHGTTPATITAVPAGNHTIEIRKTGYEFWSTTFTVTNGSNGTIPALLVSVPVTLPVTFATKKSSPAKNDLPEIHVDGYWIYPQGKTSTTNPVPLIVHTEAFNVGSADAREVTVSANFYYEGRMICWNTLYLGTLKTGDHVSTDTQVSCLLPSVFSDPDLVVRFENLVVTP
ncbi:MAG: PEGA domain-containing protein [Methanoregula sp.]|nr:PEGA domain-containing protein [Methanoregula sp.]